MDEMNEHIFWTKQILVKLDISEIDYSRNVPGRIHIYSNGIPHWSYKVLEKILWGDLSVMHINFQEHAALAWE